MLFKVSKHSNWEQVRDENSWIWGIARTWPKDHEITAYRLEPWFLLLTTDERERFWALTTIQGGHEIIEVPYRESARRIEIIIEALPSDLHTIVGLAVRFEDGARTLVILPAKGTSLDVQCRRAVCPPPRDLQELEHVLEMED